MTLGTLKGPIKGYEGISVQHSLSHVFSVSKKLLAPIAVFTLGVLMS